MAVTMNEDSVIWINGVLDNEGLSVVKSPTGYIAVVTNRHGEQAVMALEYDDAEELLKWLTARVNYPRLKSRA